MAGIRTFGLAGLFGGLAALNELVAFRTSGVSRSRLAVAALAERMLGSTLVTIQTGPEGKQQVAAVIEARLFGILCLFLLGRYVAEGGLGEALTWAAGFLCVYLVGYACKGHLMIQNDRKAKLYWLQNDAGNEAFSSNDPLVVTMPAQDIGIGTSTRRKRAT